MTPVWLAFWVGTFLGAVMGILVISLCVIARREDDAAARSMTWPPPNPVDRSPWKATAPVPLNIDDAAAHEREKA